MAKRESKLKGMPVHFIPDRAQVHFGKPGEPLCNNTGPRYVENVMVWGSTNTRASVTCTECERLWDVRNRLCRGCGTMITEESSKKEGRCIRCSHLSRRLGWVDVDKDGQVIAGFGSAKGKEGEYQNQLDVEKHAKELALQARLEYNRSHSVEESTTTEEQTMADAKVETKSTKKSDKKNDKKDGKKNGLAKAHEAAASKRSLLYAQVITLKVKENPKRDGTKAHEAYSKYKTGMTVGEFIEAGGSMNDVNWDAKHEYISLK